MAKTYKQLQQEEKKLLADVEKRKKELQKTEIVLEVTADDIKNGDYGEPSSCPIALACKRVFGIDADVNVTNSIYVDGILLLRNKSVMQFIAQFDKSQNKKFAPPKPTTFRFPINGLLFRGED